MGLLKNISQSLGRWRQSLEHKQQGTDGKDYIHPAAAGMEADQETSGHVTTPEGHRRDIEPGGEQTIHENNDRVNERD